MEVIVNYPTDKEGVEELARAVAQAHATLAMKAVNDLNLDRDSKKKVIKKLLEVVKEKSIEEERKNDYLDLRG